MPYYSVSIDGQDMNGTLSGDPFSFDEMPGVSVSFPGEEGITEYRCTECSETTQDAPATYAEGVTVPLRDQCDATECEACDGVGAIWPDGTTDFRGTASRECEICQGTGHGAHVWRPETHAWVNSARISADDDTVAVHISVGDPRGAFTMSVTCGDDGELRLSVPTPADGWAHMGLVPLRSHGYYRIVPSESAEHVAARKAMQRTADVENALQRASRDFARAGSGNTPAERNEARALILASLLDRLGIAAPSDRDGE